jgi:glycerol-3-phosphate acyltransferase PlsY
MGWRFFGSSVSGLLKFKGGKGVATYLGVLIGLARRVALVFAVVWLAVASLFPTPRLQH